MTGFTRLEPDAPIACVYSVGSAGDVGVGTAPAVPGWVPPPPPPPPPLPPANLIAGTANVGFQSLTLQFDGPVNPVDLFGTSHPFTMTAAAGPSFPATWYGQAGGTTFNWLFEGPYDTPLLVTVPADTDTNVVPITDFAVTVL